jgi:AbrB family looped-hinge helix DNA binding protein
MTITVKLDKAGRIVIPKTFRNELRLSPGSTLVVESNGASMTLRPIGFVSQLRKKRGIWVFHGDRKIRAAETDRALQGLRQERDREMRGGKGLK